MKAVNMSRPVPRTMAEVFTASQSFSSCEQATRVIKYMLRGPALGFLVFEMHELEAVPWWSVLLYRF